MKLYAVKPAEAWMAQEVLVSQRACQKLRKFTPSIRFDVRELNSNDNSYPDRFIIAQLCPEPSIATYFTR